MRGLGTFKRFPARSSNRPGTRPHLPPPQFHYWSPTRATSESSSSRNSLHRHPPYHQASANKSSRVLHRKRERKRERERGRGRVCVSGVTRWSPTIHRDYQLFSKTGPSGIRAASPFRPTRLSMAIEMSLFPSPSDCLGSSRRSTSRFELVHRRLCPHQRANINYKRRQEPRNHGWPDLNGSKVFRLAVLRDHQFLDKKYFN